MVFTQRGAILYLVVLMLMCSLAGVAMIATGEGGSSATAEQRIAIAELQSRTAEARAEEKVAENEDEVIEAQGVADVSRIVAWTDAYERRGSVEALISIATAEVRADEERKFYWRMLLGICVCCVIGIFGYWVYHTLEMERLEKLLNVRD